jgi:hypothetical protein
VLGMKTGEFAGSAKTRKVLLDVLQHVPGARVLLTPSVPRNYYVLYGTQDTRATLYGKVLEPCGIPTR